MHGTNPADTKPDAAKVDSILGGCLVEGDSESVSRGRHARRKSFGLSLAVEAALVALLVVAPLVTSVAGPQFHLAPNSRPTFLRVWGDTIPPRRAAPPRPSLPTEPMIQVPPPSPPIGITGLRFSSGAPSGDEPVTDLTANIFPGGDPIALIGRPSPATAPPPEKPVPPREKRPLKVSEGVLEAQLISRVEPRYPLLAKQTRTQGTVTLRAIISRDGSITSLSALGGHPLLVQAALDAVKQWRYRPTLLNGEPVEVETSITIIFRLHE